MNSKQVNHLKERSGKRYLKAIAYAFGGGILTFIVIAIAFTFFGAMAVGFFNAVLSVEAAMNVNLLYSCLLIPILIVGAAFLQTRFSVKDVIVPWLGIVIVGTSLSLAFSETSVGRTWWLLVVPLLVILFIYDRYRLQGRYQKKIVSKLQEIRTNRREASERRREERRLEIQAYEARRQSILLGQIEPIHVLVNLEQNERAFVEVFAKRMAIVDSVVERTVSKSQSNNKAKKKGVLTRALVGTLIAGPVGTVVGGLTARTEGKTTTDHQSETTQHVVSAVQELDSGRLVFTNKRIILLGNEIVSLPYRRLVAVEFEQQRKSARMDVKYEGMAKGEYYILSGDNIEEIDIYYRGITEHLLLSS